MADIDAPRWRKIWEKNRPFALTSSAVELGDSAGHDFHGNQWVTVQVPIETAMKLRSRIPTEWSRVNNAGSEPILVDRGGSGTISVWDGNHRVTAAHERGQTTITAEMPANVADELGLTHVVASVGRDLATNPVPTGAMVAWYPPLSSRKVIARTEDWAEAPENMHVTLSYLGKADELDETARATILRTVSLIAKAYSPFEVKESGTGVFDQGKEGLCLVALMDSPFLEKIQETITNELTEDGIAVSSDHGFTAHMTIGYMPPDAELTQDMVKRETQTLACNTIAVCFGPDVTTFPLGGTFTASGEVIEFGDTEGHPFHGNQWTSGGSDKMIDDPVKTPTPRSFLTDLSRDDLAYVISTSNRFKSGDTGGGINASRWYRDETTGEQYLVKETQTGGAQAEVMSKAILDKTDLVHMNVALGDEEQRSVVIEHVGAQDGIKSFDVAGFTAGVDLKDSTDARQVMSDFIGMDMFDKLIGNWDRHDLNFGFTKDDNGNSRVAIIDNSEGFGSGAALSRVSDAVTPNGPAADYATVSKRMSIEDEDAHEWAAQQVDHHLEQMTAGIASLRTPEIQHGLLGLGDISDLVGIRSPEASYQTRMSTLEGNLEIMRTHRNEYVDAMTSVVREGKTL